VIDINLLVLGGAYRSRTPHNHCKVTRQNSSKKRKVMDAGSLDEFESRKRTLEFPPKM